MEKRFDSLDAIKGLACIFMIFAHAAVDPKGDAVLSYIMYIGGFAPALFYAVTGVTASLQARKNNVSSVALFYVMFAVLGFSLNAFWRPNLWKDLICDVPQIIALGAIIVLIVEKYLKPNKYIYLVMSIGVFILHFYFTKNFPTFKFKQFLFTQDVSFPVIPWLLMFFAGIFAFYIKNIVNLWLAFASFFILVILTEMNKVVDPNNKWGMSFGYFLMSYFVLFIVFYIMRSRENYSKKNILIFFGKNSMLFLYVHLLIMKVLVLKNFYKLYPVWFIMGFGCFFFMKALIWLNKYIEEVFKRPQVWAVMAVLICFIPIFTKNADTIIWSELFLGILFANNYPTLSKMVKKKASFSSATSENM